MRGFRVINSTDYESGSSIGPSRTWILTVADDLRNYLFVIYTRVLLRDFLNFYCSIICAQLAIWVGSNRHG